MDQFLQKNTDKEYNDVYCRECGAVCLRNEWKWDENKRNMMNEQGMEAVLCDACHRTKNEVPKAILSLIGLSADPKQEKIITDIKNMTDYAYEKSPTARLMKINKKSDETEIYLTDDQLAKKIGRHINREYKGSLSVDINEKSDVARIVWISGKE
ncbi:hypothetical protein ACFL2D_02155 [Patescibacteria group bacterium]